MSKITGGSRLNVKDSLGATLVRKDGSIAFTGKTQVDNTFMPAGKIIVERFDKRKILQGVYEFPNLVVNQGKNSILGVYFNSTTQIASTSWFMGLINDSGFTSIQAADTSASHAGWAEFTGYSSSTRPAWGQDAAASQVISNSTPVTFTITSGGTIRGGFIISNSTKGGATGTLWAAALFTSAVPVSIADELRCTYTLST